MEKELKVCCRCKLEKNVEDFSKDRSRIDGLVSKCKECSAEYYTQNKKKILENMAKYRVQNKEKVQELEKKNREKNKEKIKQQKKEYYQKNKEKIKQRAVDYNNSPEGIAKKKEREASQEYKEKQRAYSRKQWANRTEEKKLKDKIRSRLRKRIAQHMKRKGQVKTVSATNASSLGCTIVYFMEYMERQFYTHAVTGEKMSWDNYGDWHIDHIIPLASFDLLDEGQFLKACHYSNLQPLWAEENIAKSAKILS